MQRPIAQWNPARDVWEHTGGQQNLLCEHSDVYSETFPASGTMRNGALFESVTSVERTSAPAYSSLPTVAIPTLSASDGARGTRPHQDDQLANNSGDLAERATSGHTGKPAQEINFFLPMPKASDGVFSTPMTSGRPVGKAQHLSTRCIKDMPGALLPTPNTMDSLDWREGEARHRAVNRGRDTDTGKRTGNLREEIHFDFGEYTPAIEQWERVIGRQAPPAAIPSKTGRPQLNPQFSEWLMGLPDGWVTDPSIGLTRAQQLKAIGNGVVPQQATAALADMWANLSRRSQ